MRSTLEKTYEEVNEIRMQTYEVQIYLTHFSPVSHFYALRKRQKTKGFLTFSGGIEVRHWNKMG